MRRTDPLRIACYCEFGDGICRSIWSGVLRWRDQTPAVSLRTLHLRQNEVHTSLARWQPHGMIVIMCQLDTGYIQKLRDTMPNTRIATVTFWNATPDNADLGVDVDGTAVGRMAAQYFIDQGFRNFAYLNLWPNAIGLVKGAAYRQRLSDIGATCATYETQAGHHPGFRRAGEWIRTLPVHTALFVADDTHAVWMHEIMEHARRRIPDDISVLGVGNDPDDCEAMHPPLSSVILPTPHMGESAATMLHRLIRGRKPESSRVTVTPIGIKVRQSSDIFATLEPRLQRALLFIRNNCEHPLSPRELIRVCGWNRRTMERSFRIHLDRSPLEEIHRARMQKAQELMQAGLSVTETSQRLGFKTLPHFSRVFRSVCQTTPRQYTKQL